jgi:predicted O-methyltransferase YrrM
VEVKVQDDVFSSEPPALAGILRDGARVGFRLASEPRTGSLLRVLAGSKPGGRLLELGTGTGVATAWLLAGMDAATRLETVDSDPSVVEVARIHLGGDPRVRFNIAEGGDWLRRWSGGPFDLVFADAWSGKFSDLDAALRLLAIGGLYVIDDLLPQPSWPDGHGPRIEPLLAELEGRPDLACVRLAWSSGLAVAVKRA